MKFALPLIFCFSALTVLGQTQLPTVGTIADVKGKTKYYLSAPTATQKWMLKELGKEKSLVRVNSPEEAEFFIEYKLITPVADPTSVASVLTGEEGQLDVYIMRDGRKVIAYTKGGLKSAPYIKFTKSFVKEYKGEK